MSDRSVSFAIICAAGIGFAAGFGVMALYGVKKFDPKTCITAKGGKGVNGGGDGGDAIVCGGAFAVGGGGGGGAGRWVP